MSQEEKDALTGDWTTSEKNELTLSNISVNKKIQSGNELSFLFKIKKKTNLMVLQYKVAAPQTSEYDFLILEVDSKGKTSFLPIVMTKEY